MTYSPLDASDWIARQPTAVRNAGEARGAELVHSLELSVAEAQAIMASVAPPQRVLSDELVAERRAAAAEPEPRRDS